MGWRIEPPLTLTQSRHSLPASQAALLSRYSLVELGTLCSTVLLLHVCSSWFFERWSGKGVEGVTKPEGERSSVPRSEGRRTWYYVLFSLALSALMAGLKLASGVFNLKFWICELSFAYFWTWRLKNTFFWPQDINHFEVVVAALFFQFTLYIALRLAHRGFTLGELGLVCFGGTALCLETLNLTMARVCLQY
jgi:hypothetical protein